MKIILAAAFVFLAAPAVSWGQDIPSSIDSSSGPVVPGQPATKPGLPVPGSRPSPAVSPDDDASIDLTPSPLSMLRSIPSRAGATGAPVAGAGIDALPPEGPLSGRSSSRRGYAALTSSFDTRFVTGPALVAPRQAIALLDVTARSSRWQDTVVSSTRSFAPGSVVRYSFIPLPGWAVTGVWAHSPSSSVRLPASGTWRFTSRTVLVPDVVPSDEAYYDVLPARTSFAPRTPSRKAAVYKARQHRRRKARAVSHSAAPAPSAQPSAVVRPDSGARDDKKNKSPVKGEK